MFVPLFVPILTCEQKMNVSIKPTLLKRKIKKDGTIPIYLRLTQNRKSTYIATGLAVKESEWNKNANEVRKSHRTYRQYNNFIKQKVADAEMKYLDNTSKKPISTKVLKTIITELDNNSILYYLLNYIEQLKSDGRFYEKKKAENLKVNLAEFKKKSISTIALSSIDSEFVSEFQKYLLNKVQNNPNTTARKMTTFRGFVTEMRKKGVIKHNPFELVKGLTYKSTGKTKLTPDQIDAIENLNLALGSPLWHTRNYFMYSFYNAGIRFGDLCCLTWGNIVDGRLVYKMNKTSGSKSIKQMPYHLDILNFYKQKNNKASDYIFPILKKKHTDGFELRREISSRNVVVNKNLKKIAILANVESNLSFHVSRHSFSQYALKKGLDIYTISKALGHSDIKVTQAYLADFDEELVDKSMEKLFG